MTLTILRILFLRLRNNPLELLLIFVMPVIFFTIFAAIFSNGIATGSDKKLRIGWIHSRPTALGNELRAFLEANTSLQCSSIVTADTLVVSGKKPEESNELSSQSYDSQTMESHISESQKSGRYDLIVRLPVEFPDTLNDLAEGESCPVSLVTDGQNPMAVSMVTSVVKGFMAQKKAAIAGEELLRRNLPDSASAGFRGRFSSPESELSHNEISDDSAEPFQSFKPATDVSSVFRNDPKSNWLKTDEYGVNSIDGMSSVPKHWAIAPPPIQLPMEEPDNEESFDDDRDTDKAAIEELATSELETEEITTDKPVTAELALKPVPKVDESDTVSITVENPQAATQENPRIAMYAAGIAVLFLLFSSTGNAAALLEEAESGTLDRILVSQAGLFPIIAGKWLGILLMGCLQISVMFVWAEIVFKIQLGKHLLGFGIMTFCTSAATASFAMLLATICRSRAQLNAVSVVVILSMSAVGGSMIPRFAMSDNMKEIGKWTFNAWALDGYQKVFWFQSPVTSLFREVAVLAGSALILGLATLMLSGRWRRG